MSIYVDWNQQAFLAQMTPFVVQYDVVYHSFYQFSIFDDVGRLTALKVRLTINQRFVVCWYVYKLIRLVAIQRMIVSKNIAGVHSFLNVTKDILKQMT